MEVTHIRKKVNELTLKSDDENKLLSEVVKTLTQDLQGKVGFLISKGSLNRASWGEINFIEKKRLLTLERKLSDLLITASEEKKEDEESRRTLVLQLLKQELALNCGEVCSIGDESLEGWLILGSVEALGLNHSLPESLQISIGLALKTAELQSQVGRKKRYKRLRQKVTEAIHNSQDLETILHSAIAQTTQALEISRGIVLMLRYAEPIFSNRQEISDPDVEVQPLTQWAQTPQLEAELTSFPLKESPFCLKAWQQAPIALSVENHNDLEESNLFSNSEVMSASLITPLMGKSSDRPESQIVFGFLLLENETPRQWQQEEKELVSWVSIEASTAIIHNKTLKRVQSLVDERTAQLQRSLDVQAKLYETSRHQVEQLQQLNKLKDEFLATISHELNTPLTTMKMAIHNLRRDDLSVERRQKYLGILEEEWKREHNLIKDLLTLQKLEEEGIKLQLETVNLEQLLTQLVEEFQEKWMEKGLDFVLNLEQVSSEKESLTIYSDRESLRRISFELLSNAAKYSTQRTTVEIIVSEPMPNSIRIAVKNIGHGIALGEQSYIFERFRRGKGATQKAIPGTGLGLALVKSLVEHLQGKIDLESEYNPDGVGETIFYVTLPKFKSEMSGEKYQPPSTGSG